MVKLVTIIVIPGKGFIFLFLPYFILFDFILLFYYFFFVFGVAVWLPKRGGTGVDVDGRISDSKTRRR